MAEDLFIEHQAAGLHTDYDRAPGDSWYRAVLPNPFFATLNKSITERGFRGAGPLAHRVFSRYRYAGQAADPERRQQLLAQTPFINGGLFDCLDSERDIGDGGYRINCFSDIMSGVTIKHLCAALNSSMITWYMGNPALASGMSVTRWISYTVKDIPIPRLADTEQRPFVALEEMMLAAKDADAAATPRRWRRSWTGWYRRCTGFRRGKSRR